MTKSINQILSGRNFLPAQNTGNETGQKEVNPASVKREESIELIKQQKSLWRLNSVLASDEPLKDNVPRGYYLNITV